jgi:hypothetical protein
MLSFLKTSHWVVDCNIPKSLMSAKQNAERLHGNPFEFINNVQSCSSLWYPIQMTKSKKNKSVGNKAASRVLALEKSLAKLTVQGKQKQKKKKATPFKDAGGIAGSRIGGMFGNSALGMGVGKWLGSGIGSILGSGDYQMSGPQPQYNVIANGSQIPKFSTTRQTNIVCHREYLGDILGTVGFNNTPYILNPGVSTTFPWLSSVAANYQEYRFHGLVFEFRSLITDFVTGGAPGVIVMATNYNSDAVDYTSKQQMENSEYAVSVKPTLHLMHGIECASGQTILPTKFIRTGAVPVGQDLRLYDQGIFQFATQQNPIQDLGELWVSYCVEFLKPILPIVESDAGPGFHAVRTTSSSVSPLGLTQLKATGTLPVVVSGTTIAISNAEPGSFYMLNLDYNTGSAAITLAYASATFIGCTAVNEFNNDTAGFFVSPPSGTVYSSGATANVQYIITPTSIDGPTVIQASFNGGVLPNGVIDIFVTLMDPTTIN